MIQPSFIDLLWNTSYAFKSLLPSCSGYMSKLSSNDVIPKSIVTMLPIISLDATDMNALSSRLSFISDQSKNVDLVNPPTVTFDQPLNVKAVKIALSMNMYIIVRLGGFHQLMSFLGSIGCVMEGSGLENALGTVYVPLTVVHMLTGMAYSRATRGHISGSSPLISRLLEEFWSDLTDEEKPH